MGFGLSVGLGSIRKSTDEQRRISAKSACTRSVVDSLALFET